MKTSEWIWHNGQLVPWEQPHVHVLTHALHYGSSVFEGIRVYPTPRGLGGFSARRAHRRLLDSAKIHQIKVPYSADADQQRPVARLFCATT